MSDLPDISGYWSCWFAYGLSGDDQRVPFSAYIEKGSGARFTGTTLEPNTFAAPVLNELAADISGEMTMESVAFSKLYTPGPEVHQHVVNYLGRLSDNATRISGEWHVGSGDSFLAGLFEMVRADRKTEEITFDIVQIENLFSMPENLPEPFDPNPSERPGNED